MAKTSAGSCKKRKGVIGCLVVFGFVRLNTLHILCSLTQSVQLPINAHGVRRFNRLPFKGYHFFQAFAHVILHKEDRVGTIHPVKLVKSIRFSKSQQQDFFFASGRLTLP